MGTRVKHVRELRITGLLMTSGSSATA